MTLKFLKSLNPAAYGHLEDIDEDEMGQKRGSGCTEEQRIRDNIQFARDTEHLGNTGVRHTNIAVQCNIKMTAQDLRNLQKQCIDLRI